MHFIIHFHNCLYFLKKSFNKTKNRRIFVATQWQMQKNKALKFFRRQSAPEKARRRLTYVSRVAFEEQRRIRKNLRVANHPILVGDVRKKSYLTCTLNSGVELSLVYCTCAGNSSGKNFSALANELAKLCRILVIDKGNLICAEDTYLFSLCTHSGACRTSVLCSIHLI